MEWTKKIFLIYFWIPSILFYNSPICPNLLASNEAGITRPITNNNYRLPHPSMLKILKPSKINSLPKFSNFKSNCWIYTEWIRSSTITKTEKLNGENIRNSWNNKYATWEIPISGSMSRSNSSNTIMKMKFHFIWKNKKKL